MQCFPEPAVFWDPSVKTEDSADPNYSGLILMDRLYSRLALRIT